MFFEPHTSRKYGIQQVAQEPNHLLQPYHLSIATTLFFDAWCHGYGTSRCWQQIEQVAAVPQHNISELGGPGRDLEPQAICVDSVVADQELEGQGRRRLWVEIDPFPEHSPATQVPVLLVKHNWNSTAIRAVHTVVLGEKSQLCAAAIGHGKQAMKRCFQVYRLIRKLFRHINRCFSFDCNTTMDTLAFECTFRCTYPNAKDSYKVILYTDKGLCSLPTTIETGIPQRVLLHVPLHEYPATLYANVFVRCPDLDGIITEVLLASGKVSTLKLTPECTVDLWYADHDKQGDLTVRFTSTASIKWPTAALTTSDSQRLRKDWIRQVEVAYRKYQAEDYQSFSSYNGIHGPLPVVAFVWAQHRAIPRHAQAWLWHLFQAAGALQHHLPSEFLDLDVVQQLNWVGDMLTLLFRGLLYCQDYERTATGNKASDQWVNLNSFPYTEYTGFDCEDGSGMIIQLISTIQRHAALVHPELVQVQHLLNQYTVFFAMGQIHVSEGYSPHAAVVLLDHRHADWLIQGGASPASDQWLPGMLLESTIHSESTWTASALQDKVAFEKFELARQFVEMSALKQAKRVKWNRTIKTQVPVSTLSQIPMYRTIDSLVTVNLCNTNQVAHLLCVGQDGVGVPPEQLLLPAEPNVKLHSALRLDSTVDGEDLDDMVSDCTLGQLPYPPSHDCTSVLANIRDLCTPTSYIQTVRYNEYRVYNTALDFAHRQFQKAVRDTTKQQTQVSQPLLLPITDKISVYVMVTDVESED